jgi:hypothetical protein
MGLPDSVARPEAKKRAISAAADYLEAALEHVDAALGEGRAEQYPALVAAFMQAAAADYLAWEIGRAGREVWEAGSCIGDSITGATRTP